MFWFAVIISAALLIGLAYNEQLQTMFGTSSIFLMDWLIIGAASLMYGLIAVAAHYDHHHTRHVVAAQHKARK